MGPAGQSCTDEPGCRGHAEAQTRNQTVVFFYSQTGVTKKTTSPTATKQSNQTAVEHSPRIELLHKHNLCSSTKIMIEDRALTPMDEPSAGTHTAHIDADAAPLAKDQLTQVTPTQQRMSILTHVFDENHRHSLPARLRFMEAAYRVHPYTIDTHTASLVSVPHLG